MRLVVARCSVAYSGRLDAHLPEAVRLLMFKADGSVLVHCDGGGYKPLNWMTAPTAIEEDGERIVVRKVKGDDKLEIELAEVISRHDGRVRRRSRASRRTASRRTCRSCWPRRPSGVARASGSCGASGRRTSGRST